MVPEPLTGKTLGILGVGVIGQKVARIAAALGLRVNGTRRRPAPVPDVERVPPGLERTAKSGGVGFRAASPSRNPGNREFHR